MKSLINFAFATVACLGLSACSGGGGGGANPDSLVVLPPAPATVGILLTDAHSTRWDQAFATVTSIELLGEDYRQTIFSGSETIDLLSLPDYFELFTVADDVSPGDFSKIRLHVALLELVELDDMGVELERVATKLVGNGKIDINPRGTVTIGGGDTLFIELDFDMEKALKTTETGNGQIIVRPVVFARIVPTGGSSRLTRVFGDVRASDSAAQSLVLCQTSLFANHDEDEDEDEDEGEGEGEGDREKRASERERCIVVTTDDSTGVFNRDGMPVTFADVAVGDELTAVGLLRHVADDDSESNAPDSEIDVEDDFVLAAIVLEIGRNFERYTGTPRTAVDGDLFDFLLGPNQGFAADSVIATQLFANTRIFSKSGEELDLLAIQPDTAAIVDGVIALGGGLTDDRLRAALIVLDLQAGDGQELFRGSIIAVQEGAGTFDLLVGETPRCVDAIAADIYLISDGDGFASHPGTLADLAAELRADVYGMEGVGGCIVARDILVDVSGS